MKVNPGSPFEQTIMYPSPQCYIASFMEISPLVLDETMFEGFLKGFYHIWACRPSWSCDTDATSKLLLFLPMEDPQKMVLIYQAVSEKKMFEHCYIYNALSPSPWCNVSEIKCRTLFCINFISKFLQPQDHKNKKK